VTRHEREERSGNGNGKAPTASHNSSVPVRVGPIMSKGHKKRAIGPDALPQKIPVILTDFMLLQKQNRKGEQREVGA
jgi:hypothetical protein